MTSLRIPYRFLLLLLLLPGIPEGAYGQSPRSVPASVPASVPGAEAAELVAQPTQFDFGPVAIGRSAPRELVLINRGDLPLRIDSMKIDNNAFSRTPPAFPPFTLAAGDTVRVAVAFAPVAEGVADGRLVIHADEGLPLSIPLSGVGIELRLGLPSNLDFGRRLRARCYDTILTVTNESPLPTTVTTISLSEQGEINYTLLDAPTLPLRLPPGGSFTIRLQYCPSRYGSANEAELMIAQETGKVGRTEITGRGRGPRAGVESFSLSFGETMRGTCRDTTVWIVSREDVELVLDSVDIDRRNGSGEISLVAPLGFPRVIPPGDSLLVTLRYCPDTSESDAWWISWEFRSGGTFPISVSGRSLRPAIGIDSASFAAGELHEIVLRISPPSLTTVGSGEIELFVDPDALWIEEIHPAVPISNPTPLDFLQQRSGRIVVTTNTPLQSDAEGGLLRLVVRGLLTGQPRNSIDIGRVTLGIPEAAWSRTAGIIRLSGCDVGAIAGTAKVIEIRSIRPNPASGATVVLHYHAPLGVRGELKLFDARGNLALLQTLPEGTGSVAEYRLDLTSLPRGYYIVELLDRGVRHQHPLFVE